MGNHSEKKLHFKVESAKTKVAIMIPTMNRPEFIERTIRYYCDIKSLHPIYIGDASLESQKPMLDQVLQDYPLVVRYFHWPKLNDRKTISSLAREVCNDGGKYVAFHGDDDFFIPDSLSECADFLECNSDYATAQGKAAIVSLDRPGPYGHIKSVGVYWNKKEINGATAFERFSEMLNDYWVPQFSVHRTKDFLGTCAEYEKIIDRNWGEIYQCLSFSIQGKSKYIDNLYLVRNVHTGIHHESFVEWIASPEWYPAYKNVCKNIEQQLGDSLITFEVVQKYINKYLDEGMQKNIRLQKSGMFYHIKRSILLFVPGSRLLKRWFDILVKPSEDLSLLMEYKSKFHDKFFYIHKSLVSNRH